MVRIKGRMVVNVINGRNGQFNVATLYSEIGDYVVRYDGLDEFDAGTYEGEFIVRETDIRIRAFGVGKIIEPVAYLEGMQLSEADESMQESIPEAIPDPVHEETDKPKKPATQQVDLENKAASEITPMELKKLFGEVWPLDEQVRLDPTVGRTILRAQTTYLKSIGYKYNAKEQIWIKRH